MLVHLGYETALSQEHHSYIAEYNTWNQTEAIEVGDRLFRGESCRQRGRFDQLSPFATHYMLLMPYLSRKGVHHHLPFIKALNIIYPQSQSLNDEHVINCVPQYLEFPCPLDVPAMDYCS